MPVSSWGGYREGAQRRGSTAAGIVVTHFAGQEFEALSQQNVDIAARVYVDTPSTKASPEGRHPLPQHHHDWKQMGWRGKIVVFLHWKFLGGRSE